MDSRWSCGRLALGEGDQNRPEDCELGIDLHYFRYVRQIQFGEPLRFHRARRRAGSIQASVKRASRWRKGTQSRDDIFYTCDRFCTCGRSSVPT